MKKILTSLLYGLMLMSYSQNEGAYFYFNNNGGINFDSCSGEATAVYDGRSTSSNLDSNNSTLSDSEGNLLFYSDGLVVFDKTHTVLPNGTGLSGNGNSLILPQPGSDNRFYLFTVDQSTNSSAGLEYSVIDKTLNSGNGDILAAEKRVHLITYNVNDSDERTYKCSSKLTAVKSSDCSYYWIITHFLDRFYAFKLDSTGVDPNPIVSQILPEIPMNFYKFGNSVPPISDLKISPKGNQIAMAYSNAEGTNDSDTAPKGLYIYEINQDSGVISNPVNITIPPELIGFDLVDYYAISIDYSMDGDYLYIATERDSDSGYERNPRIWRRYVGNISFPSTLELIYETDKYNGAGSLQLAPNGKIYHVRELLNPNEATEFNFSIGVINDPSTEHEDINYSEIGLNLNAANDTILFATNTLPQYNPQWYDSKIFITDNTLNPCQAFICGEQSAILSAPEDSDAIYTWYKNDVVLQDAINSTFITNSEGIYKVEMTYVNSICKSIGYAEVLESSTPPAVIDGIAYQCDGQANDGISSFRLNKYIDYIVTDTREVNVRFFTTLSDAQNRTNEILTNEFVNTSNPQTIFAAVSNIDDGCFSIAALELRVSTNENQRTIPLKNCDSEGEQDGLSSFTLEDAIPLIQSDFTEEYSISFHESAEHAELDILELVSPYYNTIPNNQSVFARIDNNNNCEGIYEIELIVEPPPNILLDEEIIYCQDSFPNTIEISSGLNANNLQDYQFLWSTGATTPEIHVNTPGNYVVQLTNGTDCPLERTISVLPSSNPIIESIIVDEFGSNNSIEVTVSGDGDYEYSIEGNDFFSDASVFTNLSAGIYNVRVKDKNGCGFTEELVSVSGFPKFFSPNGDGINDTWRVKNLSTRINFTGIIYIYDRYGKLLYTVLPNSQGWNGTYEGKRMPNSDYWFKAELNTGETFNGHFALRR